MRTQNYYEGIDHLVHLSNNDELELSCEHCEYKIGTSDRLAIAVNHYILEHGYKLLHVGTETYRSSDGTPWHVTVAILGISLATTGASN